MNKIIDYKKICEAREYYSGLGFIEIPVPWIIDFEAYLATKPNDIKDFYTLNGYLNASGEQGFVELMLRGESLDRNMCITPCFRDDEVTELNFKYFIKLELIDTNVSINNLMRLINDSKKFFDQYFPEDFKTKIIVMGDNCYDIVTASGIELDSYGIRKYKKFEWIYGTGLALPRLSIAMSQIKNQPIAGLILKG